MPDTPSPKILARRIFLYGTLPGILLLTAFAYLAVGALRLDQSRSLVVHSFDVIIAAGAIEVSVMDAERGQRGFLLTGEAKYREPYDREAVLIPDSIARLQSLTADEPDQQRRILSLQQAVTTKLNELERTIALSRTRRLDTALDLIKTDVGENAMRAVQQNVADIEQAEQSLLRDRLEAASEAERNVVFASLTAGSFALLVLAWITFELYRSFQRTYASEAGLRATLDSVREGVSAFDANHRLIAWNQPFVDILRLPADFVRKGLSVKALEEFKNIRSGVAGDLEELDLRARRSLRPLMVERQCPDGTIVELFHKPATDGGFVVTFIDVTEQRRAEAAQRQAQKMELLGQMTGGVAHDFNNLLTVVVGNLSMLKTRYGGDSNALRHVEMAMMGADRGAKLTNQLLAFARRQPLEPRPVNLAHLLPDLTEMLRRTLGELIVIEVIGSAGLWTVSIDPHQFETAVLNLAINARDAMPGGGKLTLELANMRLDEGYAARHDDVQPGQYVMFGITDAGAGMSTEVLERAFDPFFTTKGDGGTGLGLSMVFGFVKQSGGHIKIYSEIGHGTTVKLYLPRTLDEMTALRPEIQTGDISGSETILVVEDEQGVRDTVVAMLAELGYRVLEAPDGASALPILESGVPIDLMFTDVIMPGPLSSRLLAERARDSQAEDADFLFTSGYTENTIIHNGRLDPGVQLISKPYGQDELARKVRCMLETEPVDQAMSSG